MRRSRLHREPLWPLFMALIAFGAILAFGLTFHPRQTGFLAFSGLFSASLLNLVVIIYRVTRAKRRAARGIVDMTNEPDPSKGEFA